MSPEKIIALIGALIIFITIVIFISRKLPKRIKSHYYIKKWREIQKLCANPDDWSHAIVHADMLLNEVLTKKRFNGKTTGERMVNAGGLFSNNDSIWNAHKLANKIKQDGAVNLKDSEVKEALIAFGQSLRDLGAL